MQNPRTPRAIASSKDWMLEAQADGPALDVLLIADEPPLGRRAGGRNGSGSSSKASTLDMESVVRKLIAALKEEEQA